MFDILRPIRSRIIIAIRPLLGEAGRNSGEQFRTSIRPSVCVCMLQLCRALNLNEQAHKDAIQQC